MAEKAILHIQRFIKSGDTDRHEVHQNTLMKKNTPTEYPSDSSVLVHNILREHVFCTCSNQTAQKAFVTHSTQLLLWQPSQNTTDHGQVHFDMLFSSAPFQNKLEFSYWQDVQLLVPG